MRGVTSVRSFRLTVIQPRHFGWRFLIRQIDFPSETRTLEDLRVRYLQDEVLLTPLDSLPLWMVRPKAVEE